MAGPCIKLVDSNDQELIQSDSKLQPQFTKGEKSQHEVASVNN